jgi:hypothetical protein
MKDRAKAWFAPKTHGFGAGLPVSWEGWAALALFFAAIFATHRLLHGPARVVCTVVLVAAIVGVAAARTEGGWRWRWGRDR